MAFLRRGTPTPATALRTNWYHILVALAGEDRHGRAIARDVLAQTDGALHLWPATLYGALEQLSDAGLVEEIAEPDERPPGESERRRYYRLTASGRAALATEIRRVETIARLARARLGLIDATAR